jgi:hypothetical protein
MSQLSPPSHVPDGEVVAAVEDDWGACDPAGANGYLCRDQVAEYCRLSSQTLKTRLRELAADREIAAALTLDLCTYTETRAVAPVEVE